MEQVEKIKAEILKILEATCSINDISPYEIKDKVDIIEKLSASYNNLCQAQKARTIPVTEFTKDGTIRSYNHPIEQLLDGIKK